MNRKVRLLNVKIDMHDMHLIEWYTQADDIPEDLIIHGPVSFDRDFKATYICKSGKYHIIEIKDGHAHVQLGFLRKDFEFIGNIQLNLFEDS